MTFVYDLAAEYRRKIESGEIACGERLPIEGVLAERHSVSKATISRMVQLLKSEGLLYTTHDGTYAGPRPGDPRTRPTDSPVLYTCGNRLWCNNFIELPRHMSLRPLLSQVSWIERGSIHGRVHYCHQCAPGVLESEGETCPRPSS